MNFEPQIRYVHVHNGKNKIILIAVRLAKWHLHEHMQYNNFWTLPCHVLIAIYMFYSFFKNKECLSLLTITELKMVVNSDTICTTQ